MISKNNKKALVISGGGSKGAFAGGVAQYLIQNLGVNYDMFVGSSTGSLLISHLAAGNIEEIKNLYSSTSQPDVFSINPFRIKKKHGYTTVAIKHRNTIKSFLKGSKTFGESKNLLKLVKNNITETMYNDVRSKKELVVTVSNLTRNKVEYKSNTEENYLDFCDWIWASCNYVPFMSILEKNGCQYADGGFGSLVPISEAIKRGAKEIDVIVLETEINYINRIPAKNPFTVLFDTFDFLIEHVEKHNITIGKLLAEQKKVKLNFYYTPMVLTTNSLVFDPNQMKKWWQDGYSYAQKRSDELSRE